MLLISVIAYLLLTLVVGYIASRRVKNSGDFLLAGRRLPVYITTAALFATWFGSETVMGASAEFAEGGLSSVISDPLGASLCLILLGLFFARPLYRMNLLTFGDFYREKFGKTVELVSSVCLVLSYIAWIAAQMVAVGFVLSYITVLGPTEAILLGSSIVIFYTWIGGLWSVSITDFVQMILIVCGLGAAIVFLSGIVPLGEVLRSQPEGFFRLYHHTGHVSFLNMVAAWMTIGLGSLPQQDIFQRVMSSKSEKSAVLSSYLAGVMYLTIALIPLLMALYAVRLIPGVMEGESQMMLLELIKNYTPLWLQILFFGALLSAVMSTASGAILAPAAILSENLLGHFVIAGARWKLRYARLSVLFIAGISLWFALREQDIYELVEESSSLSLVSLFVPLVYGLFYKKNRPWAALLSILLGMAGWIFALELETEIEPILYGLAASVAGLLIGHRIKWKLA